MGLCDKFGGPATLTEDASGSGDASSISVETTWRSQPQHVAITATACERTTEREHSSIDGAARAENRVSGSPSPNFGPLEPKGAHQLIIRQTGGKNPAYYAAGVASAGGTAATNGRRVDWM